MKKLIIILLLICTSCAALMTTTPDYTFKYSFELKDTLLSSPLLFKDSLINIEFIFTDKLINFNLANVSDKPLTIIWDKVTLVLYGESKKIMHANIKYADRYSSQPSTIVSPKSYITDLILPSDNVYYQEGYYSTYYSRSPEWKEYDLFLTHTSKEDVKAQILALKGMSFTLYFPIEYDGKLKNYSFIFLIKDIKQL